MAWMTEPEPRNSSALKKRMGEDVENAGSERAHTKGEKHVAQLGHGRVGQHALDVVLHQSDGGGEQRCDGANNRHRLHRRGSQHKQRVRPGDHIHAGGDHGRSVDQGGHRRGTFHGVRKPDVEWDLGGLAAGADEQQQSGRGDDGIADGKVSAASHVRNFGQTQRAKVPGDSEHAQQEAGIADAVDDECLIALQCWPTGDENKIR